MQTIILGSRRWLGIGTLLMWYGSAYFYLFISCSRLKPVGNNLTGIEAVNK